MSRTLIALCGYKGSGKSTAAEELMKVGYTRIKFAQGLKAMLRCLGLGERELEGDLKEVPCNLLGGRTPRYAMQKLGAEWGREMIHPDLWINDFIRRVNETPQHIPIVCDDCRYPNEVEIIHRLGGSIVMIRRDQRGMIDTHSSEDLRHIIPDRVIFNDTPIKKFQAMMRESGLAWK